MAKEIDLAYLDSLIGTSADDISAKLLADLTDENFTVAMYRAGFLTTVTDINGNITGFDFHPPQNFDMLLSGTAGNDSLSTGNGGDFIYAADGDDIVDAGGGNDLLYGGLGNDTLYGGAGYDSLYGDEGNDTLHGDDGDDMLYGGDGADFLFGDAGNDVLNGGNNVDNLYGGAGADIFEFTADSAFSAVDGIRDFSIAEGDKIDISDLLSLYDPLTDSIENFVRITQSGSNSFVAVDSDGGGDNFHTVAAVLNTTGITDEQLLVDNGTLIV